MRLDHLFFLYMAAIGITAGALLVATPAAGDFVVKPYFWVLIAIAVFDVVTYLRGRNIPGTMIGMDARLLGLVIGVVAMVLIPWLAGAPATFF
jgi:hypothetical protein